MKINKINKSRIMLIGFSLLFVNQFTLIYTYLNAYFNGGKTMVCINLQGEQYLDALVLAIVLIISLIALVIIYRQHLALLKRM